MRACVCVCVCMCSMGGTEGMLCAIYSGVVGKVCVCLSSVVVVVGNTTHRDAKPKKNGGTILWLVVFVVVQTIVLWNVNT